MERTLITIALLLLTVSYASAADNYTVNGTGPCTATVMKNGAAYKMINLTTLDSHNMTHPMFTIQGKIYKYFYNPCSGMNITSACSTNEAVCQNLNTSYYSAGKQNFTSYNMTSTNQIMIQYTEDPTNTLTRRSIFSLMCNASATAPMVVFNSENPSGHYNFNFTWAQFCNLTSDMVDGSQGVQGTPIDIGSEHSDNLGLSDLESDDMDMRL